MQLTLSVKEQFALHTEITEFLKHKSPQYVKFKLISLKQSLSSTVENYLNSNNELIKELSGGKNMLVQVLPDGTQNPDFIKYRESIAQIESEKGTYTFEKLPFSLIVSENFEGSYENLYTHCFFLDDASEQWYKTNFAESK